MSGGACSNVTGSHCPGDAAGRAMGQVTKPLGKASSTQEHHVPVSTTGSITMLSGRSWHRVAGSRAAVMVLAVTCMVQLFVSADSVSDTVAGRVRATDGVSVAILGPGSIPSDPTYGTWVTINVSWSCSGTRAHRHQSAASVHNPFLANEGDRSRDAFHVLNCSARAIMRYALGMTSAR
jgi:hypothetical protein